MRYQVPLAEVADVVGVEVREQDGADALAVDVPEGEPVPRPGAGVDDPETAGREHRDTRLRAGRVRQRCRRAAEQHA
jgi:hypothetical protein